MDENENGSNFDCVIYDSVLKQKLWYMLKLCNLNFSLNFLYATH